jgi:hypothetical protein
MKQSKDKKIKPVLGIVDSHSRSFRPVTSEGMGEKKENQSDVKAPPNGKE